MKSYKKKNKTTTKLGLLLIILGSLFAIHYSLLALPFPVSAQQITKLTAIPPRLELEVRPGEVVVDQIKVRNEGNSQMAVELKVMDFIVADKEGTPIPTEEELSGRWAASLWITVSPQKFLLNPGETKVLDFVAVVPEDAVPGGHYAVVFHSPAQGDVLESEVASGIIPNVGTLVYLTVAGDIKEDARVIKMDVPKFQEYGPVPIETEVQNLSDVHIKPTGTIKVYNWLGKLNQTLELDGQNIFPTASRLFENNWDQKWGLGKYKVQLEASYGSQGKALLATVFFWIVPWRIITITLLIVVLTILLIIYFKKPKEIKTLPPKE